MHASNDNHASIEQLLDIKDGIPTPLDAHVRDCQVCAQQLRQLQAINQQMYDSANQQAPAHVWQRVQETVAHQDEQSGDALPSHLLSSAHLAAQQSSAKHASTSSRWGSLNTAIYTLALSILATGLLGFYTLNNQQTAVYQQSEELQASIEQLMLNSRGLESVLQKVNDQGSGLTAAERDVADRLYWRLMYVDQMIHENTKLDQQDPQKIQVLWGDRVNALTELNQLFYGGSNNVDDPEI